MFYQGAHEMHCALFFSCSYMFLHVLTCFGQKSGRRVSKEGVPSHGTNLGFTSAGLLEGFSRGACPFHGTCLDFTSSNWLMWFDSLPLLGPGGLSIFLFLCFLCVFFSREILKHQVSRRTSPIHTTVTSLRSHTRQGLSASGRAH